MAKERMWREVTTVSEDGELWDKNEVLEGLFVKVEQDIGPNKSKMYTVKTTKGEIKFWGGTVLDDKLMGVPVGSYVKIEYEGKVQGKRGEYNSYKVFVDADSAPTPSDDNAPVTDEEVVAKLDQDTLDSIPF